MIDKNQQPILILHGSKQPYLSIGVMAGGMKFNGNEYLYLPERDAFLRKSSMKDFKAHCKKGGTWDSFVEKIINQ